MPDAGNHTTPPRTAIRSLIINSTAVMLTLAVFMALAPHMTPPSGLTGPAARLAFALPLLVWPAAILLGMVLGTAIARALVMALNPIDDPESRLYRVCQRILTNSVEQTLIFIPGLLALAVLLPEARLGVVELVLALFVAGRLLFWAGYLLHPMARTPGMAITLTVNIGLIGWLLVQLID